MNPQKAIGCILVSLFLFPGFGYSQVLTRLDNTTDQESLLVFKSQVTNDPFQVLETWNSNTSFCNWKGVTCNITKQRVTSLNLKNLNLAGTISPYIANLSFLSLLNLQNNSFYGSLPREVGRLFQLQQLSLGNNLIQGAVPSSLSLCSRLMVLDMSSNRFEGIIPYELGELRQLQVLHLSKNFLTGSIPSSVGNISSLTNLMVAQNSLHGLIPEEVGRLSLLLNLQIHQNNLTGQIPPALFNCSSLIVVIAILNNLTGGRPSNTFSRLPSLTSFSVGGNNLTGPLPLSLANASKLEQLDISINNFTGRIPPLGLPNIQFLNLGQNQLVNDGEDGMDFISSLANSTELQIFSLVENRLTGKLPSSIGNLSKVLSQLLIGQNHFEGSLPAEMSNLVGLTLVSLEYNTFTGEIPPWIGEFPVLQELFLHENNFYGQIPVSLGNLTQLYEISLRHNNLSGSSPASLGNFEHLQALDLSENKLVGKIPREIFSLPSLGKVLNLSRNSLTGSLSTEIGQLKAVQGLDFSKNRLSADVPASIGGCSSLLVLDLSGNHFQGEIPNSLSDLKGIEYLDVSSNNLSGRIPSSLQSFKFLQVFNLSNNHLEGDVPKEGIFMNSTVVSLDGNLNLCGGAPKLKLPNCINPRKHSNRSNTKLIIGLVVGFTGFVILVLLFFTLRKRVMSKHEVCEKVVSFEGPHTFYTYHDLRIATSNFDRKNLIGEGSFGFVYKGFMTDGVAAAIKVFNLEQYGAFKSFLSECEALRNVRHRNLIRIVSACSNNNFKALVLHYMSNGSLEQWLHKTSGPCVDERRLFDVKQRLEIAKDVASAMEYLHHDCETPVVHCDLKPSNILLDEDMVAHVSDFGLARMLLNNRNEHPLSSTLGLKAQQDTLPQLNAEYGLGGGVSTKGDVYSYGIMTLEMFTKKKPTNEMFIGELNLQKWVSTALPDRVLDIVDPEVVEKNGTQMEQCLVSMMKIGLLCTEKSPGHRPTMRDVSVMVKSVKNDLLYGFD